MINIRKMLQDLVAKEDKWSNDPDDPGGKTAWGWTEKSAREYGYTGTMEALAENQPLALSMYEDKYFRRPGFDKVAAIAPLIGNELFECGVNCGTGTATKFMQKWLNNFNNDGKLYPDIAEDGGIGPKTLEALKAYLRSRDSVGERVLHFAMNCEQVSYYSGLRKEKYLWGWVANRAFNDVIGA